MEKVLSFAIRIAIGLSAFCFLLTNAYAQQQPVFYFAAHEDDWQLFMGKQAFVDSALGSNGVKMVFVTLTAGDDGNGAGGFGATNPPTPYYVARENGSIASVKLLADYQDFQNDGLITDIVQSTASINNHPIQKVTYRNMVAYYLRLPDGNVSGAGFPGTGYQSLKNFATGASPTLTAVDQSTTYTNWSDLTSTINTIVQSETESASYAWINVPNTNLIYNPNDHSDHYYTSYAAQGAMAGLSKFGFNGFMDYNTSNNSANLNADQIENKAALFGIVNYGRVLYGAFSTWDGQHKAWLSREYSQVIRSPQP